MNNPRLRHLPNGKKTAKTASSAVQTAPLSAIEFEAASNRYVNEMRNEFGSASITNFPLINPAWIMEQLEFSPLAAAHWCHKACGLLGLGHRQRVREYLVVAYNIAYRLRDNKSQIADLANDIIDGRRKTKVPVEKITSEFLHYLFIYIFFQSGFTSRDRATQYAQGLQPYFDAGAPPNDVERCLKQHGPDRLRRAAMRRTKLVKGAQEWAARKGAPSLANMDEILLEMAAEEEARKTAAFDDNVCEPELRSLPSDGRGQNEDDSEDDQAYVNEDINLGSPFCINKTGDTPRQDLHASEVSADNASRKAEQNIERHLLHYLHRDGDMQDLPPISETQMLLIKSAARLIYEVVKLKNAQPLGR